MPHRTSDQHHLREARRPSHLTDGHTDQTTAAYRAMLDGTYKGARSRQSGDDFRNQTYSEARAEGAQVFAEPTREQVRDRLRTSAVVPSVLSVPCPQGHAPIGEPCVPTAQGVCWARVVKRASTR